MSLSRVVAAAGGEPKALSKPSSCCTLKGCIVTADALHCHRRFTKTVRRSGGDYVLAAKELSSSNAGAAIAIPPP